MRKKQPGVIPATALQKLMDASAGEKEGEIYIPASYIRDHPELTVGQAVVGYLTDELGMTPTDAGRAIGKTEATIRRSVQRIENTRDPESNDTSEDPEHGSGKRPSKKARPGPKILCGV